MTGDNAKRRTLGDWLDAQLAAHPSEIELGLDRVGRVADALALRQPAPRSVIIGGTNGKGSCVALTAGLIGGRARVGCYTSPHLWRYNERVVIDGAPVSDAELIEAFEAIEAVRGDTSLTFFEWGTLAALWLFKRANVDVAILEVGLGGRLDAVNIVDGDIALVVSIGLDHMDWLGDTREAIGQEKAGIFRSGRVALCAERDLPVSVATTADALGARLERIGHDFDIAVHDDRWRLRDDDWSLAVPIDSRVYADNLAAGVAVVRRLGFSLDVEDVARAVRAQAMLAGRIEWQAGRPAIVYDVGHNAAAVTRLVETLQDARAAGRIETIHMVIGMLADKPVETVGTLLKDVVDRWYPVDLSAITPRGATANDLADRLGLSTLDRHLDPRAAVTAACHAAAPSDCIVVCGSFYTVAQVRDPKT